MERVIQTLLTWYNLRARNLPWRETLDPYRIWLSEVILQQTRVAQGMDYYHKFVEKCKNVNELASLDEAEVLKLWQGLGYYSRARNLHKSAQKVVDVFGGQFPKELDELQNLPGVGEYTSNAIRAFAFNLPAVAIDGNVKRVSSRWFGVDIPINKSEFSREIYPWLMKYCEESEQPNLFNQALIELGAMVCTPTNPKCGECPLNESCFANLQKRQNDFPVLEKKKKPLEVRYQYVALHFRGNWAMYCRPDTEIWAKLYEFPLQVVASETDTGIDSWLENLPWIESGIIKGRKEFKHQLTHRTIRATCWVVEMGDKRGERLSPENETKLYPLMEPYQWVREVDMELFPIHRLMEKMMKFAKDCISS